MDKWPTVLLVAFAFAGCGDEPEVCDSQSMELSSFEAAPQAHFSGSAAWDSIGGGHSASLEWLDDGTQAQLDVVLDEDFESIAWIDGRRRWSPSNDECTHHFEVRTRATVSTTDGALPEATYDATVLIYDARVAWIRIDPDPRDVEPLIDRFDGGPSADLFILASILPGFEGTVAIAGYGPDGEGDPQIHSIADFR